MLNYLQKSFVFQNYINVEWIGCRMLQIFTEDMWVVYITIGYNPPHRKYCLLLLLHLLHLHHVVSRNCKMGFLLQ